MKILLVRHGFTDYNETGAFAGALDVKLTEIGLKQAELCSKYILDSYKVDAVYASDLSRAILTVKPVADALNLPVIIEKGVREIFGGKWEGLLYVDIGKQFPEDLGAWLKDMGNVKCTGGESFAEVGERAISALTNLAKKEEEFGKDRLVVVGTHAGVIRALECKLKGMPYEKVNDIPWANNASITELEFVNGELKYIDRLQTDYLNGLNTVIKDF